MPERNSKIDTQVILESSRNRLMAGNARSISPHAKEFQSQQQPSDGSWGMGINVWYPESPARNSFSF
jgi:hypothetical protein